MRDIISDIIKMNNEDRSRTTYSPVSVARPSNARNILHDDTLDGKIKRSTPDPECLLLEVRYPRTYRHEDKGKFTDYEIYIETNKIAFSRRTSTVRRRFSEFRWLRKQLASVEVNGLGKKPGVWIGDETIAKINTSSSRFSPKMVNTDIFEKLYIKQEGFIRCPNTKKCVEKMRLFSIGNVPDLPPKKVLGRFQPTFLHSRQQGLENFLKSVLEINKFLSYSGLHLFLQSPMTVDEIEGFLVGKYGDKSVEDMLVDFGCATNTDNPFSIFLQNECKDLLANKSRRTQSYDRFLSTESHEDNVIISRSIGSSDMSSGSFPGVFINPDNNI